MGGSSCLLNAECRLSEIFVDCDLVVHFIVRTYTTQFQMVHSLRRQMNASPLKFIWVHSKRAFPLNWAKSHKHHDETFCWTCYLNDCRRWKVHTKFSVVPHILHMRIKGNGIVRGNRVLSTSESSKWRIADIRNVLSSTQRMSDIAKIVSVLLHVITAAYSSTGFRQILAQIGTAKTSIQFDI